VREVLVVPAEQLVSLKVDSAGFDEAGVERLLLIEKGNAR
jgi:hypothetical protein